MHNIEIDFEVFKALTNLRDTEKTTYNDVVRRLLKLSDAQVFGIESVAKSGAQPSSWVTKGVTFPEGTEFRASYKGTTVYANVKDSTLVVNGERASSPSDAARIVTGNSVNGWTFWQCRLPGESRWRGLQGMRNS